MIPAHPATRSPNLIDLLRRMAAIQPDALNELVTDCTQSSTPEIRTCLNEFGPFGGLVRLARLFPHGYLDTSSSASTPAVEASHREELGDLLEGLNERVPGRLSSTRSSVHDARLDDVVFREIQDICDKHKEQGLNLLEQLFAVYDVAPQLPRLSELVSSLEGEVDLSDAVVVGHQHILGTVASQFEALWQLGLKPSRTYVVGKPYSTNRLTAMYLASRGCSVRPGLQFLTSSPRWAIQSPDWYQNDNHESLGYIFAQIVRELPKQDVSRLVVLDDGGLILSWLNRAFENDPFSAEDQELLRKLRVVGVEQTTFGRHLIERMGTPKHIVDDSFSVPIPIGNVAETRLKLEKESVLIADSVVRELDAWIRASSDRGRHVRTLREATVGVIGFGVVGSWVCKALQQAAVQRIVVFDSDVSHSSIARSVGFHVAHSERELASQCEVIVGCTGARSGVELTADMIRPRTILASASSGNYEFTRAFLSSKEGRHRDINPEVTPNRDASTFDWVHSIYPIEVPNGIAYVLNGGFPVNFTGAVDPIRTDDIELTRCLIMMGLAAALKRLGNEPNFGGPVQLVTVNESPLTEMFGS